MILYYILNGFKYYIILYYIILYYIILYYIILYYIIYCVSRVDRMRSLCVPKHGIPTTTVRR